MADYDSGEITDRERLAADRQKEIASYNANAINKQLQRQRINYDDANTQNRRLADVQLKQVGRKAEADRFEANRDLQNAALGLLGSMNQAMNGSTVGNLMRMLENRSDKDNQTYWNQLQQDRNSINNAYEESVNQNVIASNEASANAEKAIADIRGDLAANMSNINPNLYEAPGSSENGVGNDDIYMRNRKDINRAALSGYIMPENSVQTARNMTQRNQLGGNDYFSRLMNQLNRR